MVTAAPEAPPAAASLRFPTGARNREAGIFYDEVRTQTAGSVVFPEAQMPPGDWLADVTLWVTMTTAGNSAVVAFQADGPWSAIAEIRFMDAAGNSIYSLTGYSLMLINLLGGYYGQNDPTDSPLYTTPVVGSGATGGSFSFGLHLPIEIISRDAVGVIPNGASNSVCRVGYTLAPSVAVYSTAPTALGAFRVRMFETGYVLPSTDSPVNGLPYATQPPGAGTFQQWSEITLDFAIGRTRKPHTRKGNVYRTLLFVARTAAGVRSDTALDELTFNVDGVSSIKGPWAYLRHRTWQRQPYALTKLPAGVVQVSYCHEWDGKVGGEMRDWWIPTQPGTDVNFDFVATTAGQLQIITNEVVPKAGTDILRG